ncbi:MAG TPA: nucleotidyltransferase family protein [Pyrinomonadaceae bacterium]|jgi:hypothetical protein
MLDARPEDKILLHVARPSLEPNCIQECRRLFESSPDWSYLIETADRHCVIPRLCRRLDELEVLPPSSARNALLEADHENTNSNLFLTGELVKLLELLKANNLNAIPFKGPTLSLAAYGDIGSRQFADLDVLIRKTDLLKLKQLLIAHGFTSHWNLSPRQEAALVRFDCAWNFANQNGVLVDVHWDLVERHFGVHFDVDRLWKQLQPVTIAGKEFSTLANEDLLLVLCLHGFTHCWERLGWICDVAGLIERQQIDWSRLMQDAGTQGSRRIVMLGLKLAQDLLDAALPQPISKLVKEDSAVNKVAERIRQQMFKQCAEPAGMFDEARLSVSLRERRRDQIRSSLRLAATPRSCDWMSVSLPASCSFLYYLIRPLRLAGKYGSRAFIAR